MYNPMRGGEDQTNPMAMAPGVVARSLRLVIVGENSAATFSLPDHGEVVIGRSAECGVVIEDPKISRRHAILRLGITITLEDLGSSNGTRVGNQQLVPGEPVELSMGDMLVFGATVTLLQASMGARPRRIWSHGYFEARMEDECARGAEVGHSFGLLRIRFEAADAARVASSFETWLRPMDVVGSYASTEYELLLLETDADAAQSLAGRIRAELSDCIGRIDVGVAAYPRDGRTPERLVSAAGRFAASPDPVPLQHGALGRMRPVVERIAAGTITVLILGETGAGKEVLANVIHRLSPRSNKPLVCLNCAALAETLLESELFGHERGAFTGATQAKRGLLESAEGGTILLDEVGEMPLALQAKLLRVLERREVVPVGSLKARAIDVRFISATNRDLESEVARGTFRQDLYYRLNGVVLVMPPLRERTDEIEDLARGFLAEFSRQLGRERVPRLSSSTHDLLRAYSWPGNIRELRNMMERAVLLCAGDVITLEHLPEDKMGRTLSTHRSSTHAPASRASDVYEEEDDDDPPPTMPPGEWPTASSGIEVEAVTSALDERARVVQALERCAGNQTQAAKLLGISRGTLIARLRLFDLARPRKKTD